jgi:hypothetical protein
MASSYGKSGGGHSMPSGRRSFGYDTPLVREDRANPRVTSKHDARRGRNETTGDQPAPRQHETVAPSMPPKTHTDRLPPGGVVRTVGHAPDGSGRWLPPTHANGHHGSDAYHHDPRVSTDGEQGMAHAAGPGKPSPRPARHNVPPAGTRSEPHGHLNRK